MDASTRDPKRPISSCEAKANSTRTFSNDTLSLLQGIVSFEERRRSLQRKYQCFKGNAGLSTGKVGPFEGSIVVFKGNFDVSKGKLVSCEASEDLLKGNAGICTGYFEVSNVHVDIIKGIVDNFKGNIHCLK